MSYHFLFFPQKVKCYVHKNESYLKIILTLGKCPCSVLSILEFDYQFKPIFMTPYFNWFHYIRAMGGNFIIQFFSLPIVTIRYILSQKQRKIVTNNRLCISSFVGCNCYLTLVYCIMILLFTIILCRSRIREHILDIDIAGSIRNNDDFWMLHQNELWRYVASLINVLETEWFN